MVADKLLSLLKTVLPIIFTGAILSSTTIVSMMFLGNIGDTELAGASLAIGFANITGYSILKGLAAGMEPICSQAFGARKWSILGQAYVKTLCLLVFASVPISILWLKMGPILLYLGQDKEIVSVAKVYILYSIPDLLAQAHYYPLRAFLRSQNRNIPLMLSVTASMFLHFPINQFLVNYLNLGFRGVALAACWNSLNTNIGLVLYLLMSRKAVKPWDRFVKAPPGTPSWQSLLALAGPSVVSVCLEWWWYEVMLLLSGLLSNPHTDVAAMGILIQTMTLFYVFPSSLSSGLTTLVGNELGAGEPKEAKKSSVVGLSVAIFWGILAFAYTNLIKYIWGTFYEFYTRDTEILHLVYTSLPILGFCELWNGPKTAICGILMGCARPIRSCSVNILSFYIIGLPVAVILGFIFKMDFVGLCVGLVAAQVSCFCLMVVTLVETDWKDQAKRATELTRETEEDKNELVTNLLS